MSDPAFRSSQRQALDEEWMPDWTIAAACRGIELPGRVWRGAYSDEIAAKSDPDAYAWSENAIAAMKVCHTCPVQLACLAYSMNEVPTTRHFGIFGGVPGRIREHFATQPCPDCGGKGYTKDAGLGLRFSDYADLFKAGSPGFPCRTCGSAGKVPKLEGLADCLSWARAFAHERGWVQANEEERTA